MGAIKLNTIYTIAFAIVISQLTGCEDPPLTDNSEKIIIPAQAEAGPIQLRNVGTSVQLDANESTGTDIQYHWTLRSVPAGSAARISNFEAVTPSFFIDQPGSYVTQLVVVDGANGTSKDFAIVNTPGAITRGSAQSLVDHTGYKLACKECHNGVAATGRPVNHIPATETCEVCHSVAAWTPNIAIDHNEVFGVCSNCHNGVNVLGRSVTHIETAEECNQCHIPGTSFTIALFPSLFTITEDSGDDDEEESDHPPINGQMCVDCHNNIVESGKPGDHILTTDACEACHTTNDWEQIIGVDHTQVVGVCSSCHSKPNGHIETTAECNACHSTTQWTPTVIGSGVDHSLFTQATVCMACHDGTNATGKPPGHVVTTSDCDSCHNTTSFVGADGVVVTVDHSTFTQATVCMDCHDGTTAIGKPVGHVVTSSDCDVCHNTTAFVGGVAGTVDHSTFTQTTVCLDCHNGTTAIGKPLGHIVTSSDCDVCHNTTLFAGVTLIQIDHSGFTLDTVCMDCHNGTIATGKPPGHIVTSSDCDACHNMAAWD